jgi:hypothetical protein
VLCVEFLVDWVTRGLFDLGGTQLKVEYREDDSDRIYLQTPA